MNAVAGLCVWVCECVSEWACLFLWKSLLMCICSFCSTRIIVSVYSSSLHCTMQHTLTSFFCPHSHFFTKVSCSILVCCSDRHIVGRVGHQTNDIIRHCHPSRDSKCSIKGLIHIIRRVHSSVLYLIGGQIVVMGWKERQSQALSTSAYIIHQSCRICIATARVIWFRNWHSTTFR